MADQKITDLTADVSLSATDLILTVTDPAGTPTNHKVALSTLLDWIEANGGAPASFLSSGTLADARVAESNVTQHEGALTVTEAQISDLGAYITDYTVTEGDVTQHEAALTLTESQISDLQDYLLATDDFSSFNNVDATVATPSDGNILVYRDAGNDWVLEAKPAGGSNPAINDVTDVTISAATDNEVLAYDNGTSTWINQTAAEAGLATASHTHTESDITDLGDYLTDYTVTEGDVTAHEAALTITESQISDLGTYQVQLSEGAFVDGDKTKLDGIETNADVTDAANVETAIEAITLTSVTGATGDEVLVVDATDGGLKAVLWENLPSGGSGDAWSDAVDADIVPDADGTRDLGSTANRFAELHVDSIDLNGTTLDGTTLSDPGADRLLFWDDSESTTDWLTVGSGLTLTGTTLTADGGGVTESSTDTFTNKTIDGDNNTLSNLDIGNEVDWAAAADVTDAGAFEAGDKLLVFEAGVGMRKVDYSDLPGAGGGLSNIVEDTTPQLGGDLDLNGNVITGMVIGTDIQAFDADTLKADTTDELAVGYTQTVNAIGTVSSGTTTLAFADSNVQTLTNGGAFTLAPPSTGNGVITLEVTNNASAGAITTSGFSSVTGDSFTTTDGDIFLCSVAKIGSNSYLNVVAHAGNA